MEFFFIQFGTLKNVDLFEQRKEKKRASLLLEFYQLWNTLHKIRGNEEEQKYHIRVHAGSRCCVHLLLLNSRAHIRFIAVRNFVQKQDK